MQKKAPPARSRQGDHCRLRDTTFRQRQCPAGILEPCHFVIAKTGGGGFGAIAFDKGFQRIAKLGGCVEQRHVVIQPELKRLAVGVTHLDFINVFGPRAFVRVEKDFVVGLS
jgi:hypothetical protein